MKRGIQKNCLLAVALCGLAQAAALPARAALVELDIYVSYSILNSTTNAPIADGSWVEIVGSGDSVNNGMATVGGTNYLATSVQGNDTIHGYVYIGDNSYVNTGMFFQTVSYDTTNNVGYVYIRYFQSTSVPDGMTYWGQSDVYNLSPTNFGVVSIDVNPGDNLVANLYDNFVVIPEPGTAVMFLMAGGLLFSVRRVQRKRLLKQAAQNAIMKHG